MFSASPRRAAFSSSLLLSSSSSASSLEEKESGRDPRIETTIRVEREREDKMEGSKMGSDSGHT